MLLSENTAVNYGVYIFIVCAAVSVTLLICHLRAARLLKKLNLMLDSAAAGNFHVDLIDESMMSSLEFKLADYLSGVEASRKNAYFEKDRIKTLISDISHQTKTPISNIKLYAELLSERKLDETNQLYINALTSQTNKLNFLIVSLIKMSRLETGILSLYPKPDSVARLIENLYVQYAPKARSKKLDFKTITAPVHNAGVCSNGISVDAAVGRSAVFDFKWTLEALGNIVDNAIKYTDSGSVTIETVFYEMFCCIKITDTGCGIDEEEQAQIFGRFYRSPRHADKEGVGIGLYLAREIIFQENGYIKLASAKDRGSSFSVFLPLSNRPAH